MSGDIPAGPITVENISTIVSKLKRRKATGSERITFEHILFGGNQMLKCIVKHFNSVILHGQVPHAWKQGITVPLYKGGYKTENIYKQLRHYAPETKIDDII